MSNPPLHWFFMSDPFNSYFYRVTATVSIVSNSLLIAAIMKNKSTAMGNYRYLLLCFAIADMIISLTHLIVLPIVHMNPHGFFFFPHHVNYLKSENGIKGKGACLFYIMIYYETFNLLAFHFIYRYRVLVQGRLQEWTYKWRLGHWLSASLIFIVVHATILLWSVASTSLTSEYTLSLERPEILDLYGVDTRDPNVGYVLIEFKRLNQTTGLEEWDLPTVIMFTIYVFLFGLSSSVMVVCSTFIIKELKDVKVSTASKVNQTMLFRVLLLQTLVPCLFSYFPLCIMWFYPLTTEKALGGIGNILVMSSAIFPSIDAIIIIYFIPAYRNSVFMFFLNRIRPSNAIKNVSMSVSSNSPSNNQTSNVSY